jgi:hypothetical protein
MIVLRAAQPETRPKWNYEPYEIVNLCCWREMDRAETPNNIAQPSGKYARLSNSTINSVAGGMQ